MKIGIIGTRGRDSVEDLRAVYDALAMLLTQYSDKLHTDPLYPFEIVSGGCPEGGDRFAEILAKKYQVPIKVYHAPWRKLKKGAGYARNKRIAQDADVLIACVGSNREGGTEDTIKEFRKLHPAQTVVEVE